MIDPDGTELVYSRLDYSAVGVRSISIMNLRNRHSRTLDLQRVVTDQIRNVGTDQIRNVDVRCWLTSGRLLLGAVVGEHLQGFVLDTRGARPKVTNRYVLPDDALNIVCNHRTGGVLGFSYNGAMIVRSDGRSAATSVVARTSGPDEYIVDLSVNSRGRFLLYTTIPTLTGEGYDRQVNPLARPTVWRLDMSTGDLARVLVLEREPLQIAWPPG
jgi:hypothetical protein